MSDLFWKVEGKDIPGNYGWFHIMFIILMLIGTVALCYFGRKFDEKKYNRTLLIFWIGFVALEVYKQFTFGLEWEGWKVTGYAWYTFPFQLCATPLYVLPFAIFFKNKHIKDAATSFMMFYSIFGGLAVYAFPNDVFCARMDICIQSMIYHGMMLTIGVFMALFNKEKLKNPIFYLKGCVTFLIMITLATILNEIVFAALKGSETFNMFFISTHYDSTLPVLSMLNGKVHPVLRIFIYYIAFTIIGAILYGIEFASIVLVPNLVNKNKQNTKEAYN